MSLSVCSIPWTYFNSSVKDCDGTITFIDSVTDLSESGYLLSCAIPFEENDGKTNWVNCKDSYESVLKQDITASHIFYDFTNPVIVNTYVKGDEGGLTNYSGQDFLDALSVSTETTYSDYDPDHTHELIDHTHDSVSVDADSHTHAENLTQEFLTDLVTTFDPDILKLIVMALLIGVATGFGGGMMLGAVRKIKNMG